jgi:tetratricopeptide (TPR) repeat protein
MSQRCHVGGLSALLITGAVFAFLLLGMESALGAGDEGMRVQLAQKIRLTSTLISDSPAAQRVARSGNPQAVAHLDEGRVHHALAEELLARGDLVGARRAVADALHHLGLARRMAPDAPARQAAAKQRYEQYVESVERLVDALRIRAAAQSPSDAHDQTAAIGLVGGARQLAQSGRYDEANQTLAQAEAHVLSGLNRSLAGATLDYTERPASSADEFQYEVARYRGFAELLPLAVRELKPRPKALAQIERYDQTSSTLQARAIQQFQQGDTRQALVNIRNATLHIQRALRAAGLVEPQPTGSLP